MLSQEKGVLIIRDYQDYTLESLINLWCSIVSIFMIICDGWYNGVMEPNGACFSLRIQFN